MAIVAWLDSPLFDRHTNGYRHPECPERLKVVREAFATAGLITRLTRVSPPDVSRALLEKIHDPAYVSRLERICAEGGGSLDPDTSVVPDSWSAALKAAGAVAMAAEKVACGTWKRAFCSVRPPGHHAPRGRAMGFCLFDNVAVGAQAALDTERVSRVAILDWDVHHGNGTQAIFYSRADVLYASWHQYPFYPGTGAESETGKDRGAGTTVNCPLPAGSGDREMMSAWDGRIRPALERFEPGLILISAGFDADRRDPLAGLNVTASGFQRLSETVVRWCDAHCGGRIVSVLEGGYHLEALAEDTTLHVETLL